MATTRERVGSVRERGAKSNKETRAEAVELVSAADELVAEVLQPGRWPQRRTVERFMEDDRLERVLALYGRAIRLDPDEPAYPWNLSATLSKLGLSDLALAFMTRAVHVAERVGDEEWSDFDAHVALAELAVDAGEPEMALMAIVRAQELGETQDGKADLERLLKSVEAFVDDAKPRIGRVARLLESLAS